VKAIPVSDFATEEYPSVTYDERALDALERMIASKRDYAMVVEEGDVLGVLEQAELVFAFGRGELKSDSRVSDLARDLPCVDPDSTFDDVVAFMAGVGIFQVCIDNRVMDDFMLLRAIWTERLAVAREFREYERPRAMREDEE
jgi:CBS domain-containing protein